MKRTLKNMGVFFGGAVLARGCGMLQAFVIARSFGPANYGLWVTLLIVASYFPIVGLGVTEALVKMIPQLAARGETERLRRLEGAVLAFVLVLAAVELVLLPVFRRCAPLFNIEPDQGWMMYPLVLTVAIGHFSGTLYNRLTAYEFFKAAATVDFARAASSLAFVGGLGWKWGIKGAVLGYVLQELTACSAAVSLNLRLCGPIKPLFDWKMIAGAIKIGLPITLIWWIIVVKSSVDRVLLGMFFGKAEVGYYGLGISIINILAMVPTIITRVLYPQVNRKQGASADLGTMRQVVVMPSLALAILLVNIQAAALSLAPFVYNMLLPKYRPGLGAAEVLILGAFFAGLLGNGANFLIASHQERRLLKWVIATLILTIVLDTAPIKLGLGIGGVAVGTSLAGAYLCTVVWLATLNALEGRNIWRTIFNIYAPLFGLVAGVGAAFAIGWAGSGNLWSCACMAALLFTTANAALFFLPAYRTEMKSLGRRRESPPWLRRGIALCFGS